MPCFNHTHIEYELQLIYKTEMSNARRLMYHVSTSRFEWIKYFGCLEKSRFVRCGASCVGGFPTRGPLSCHPSAQRGEPPQAAPLGNPPTDSLDLSKLAWGFPRCRTPRCPQTGFPVCKCGATFRSPSLPLPNRYEATKEIEQVQDLQ